MFTDNQGESNMLNLDLKKAQELVAECIAEKGEDYVYEKEGSSCKYVHDVTSAWDNHAELYEISFESATPGCIVGAALHKGGIPLDVMGADNMNDNGSMDLLNKLAEKGLVTFTEHADNYLANVQTSQDGGAPWGRSAEAAARGRRLTEEYDEFGQRTGDFVELEGEPVA